MSAGQYNFICEQGATFARTMSVLDSSNNPRNFSGYTGRMQVRRRISDVDVLVELTTENGRMTLGSDGVINLILTATETSAITDEGVYDIELEDSAGVVERLLEGSFFLTKEVTR